MFVAIKIRLPLAGSPSETTMESRDLQHASHMPVMPPMRQAPTAQIRGLTAMISQCESQGPSKDPRRWERATLHEWEALVQFHSNLTVARFLLLIMSRPFQSSVALPVDIWQGVTAFLNLYSASRSQFNEPVTAMINTATSTMALLYYYLPMDRDIWIQCLKMLGAYRFVSSFGIPLPFR